MRRHNSLYFKIISSGDASNGGAADPHVFEMISAWLSDAPAAAALSTRPSYCRLLDDETVVSVLTHLEPPDAARLLTEIDHDTERGPALIDMLYEKDQPCLGRIALHFDEWAHLFAQKGRGKPLGVSEMNHIMFQLIGAVEWWLQSSLTDEIRTADTEISRLLHRNPEPPLADLKKWVPGGYFDAIRRIVRLNRVIYREPAHHRRIPFHKIPAWNLFNNPATIRRAVDEAFFVLVHAGFKLTWKDGRFQTPDIVRKAGWLRSGRADRAMEVLECFAGHVGAVIRPQFPPQTSPEGLALYLSLTTSRDTLEEIFRIHLSTSGKNGTRNGPSIGVGTLLYRKKFDSDSSSFGRGHMFVVRKKIAPGGMSDIFYGNVMRLDENKVRPGDRAYDYGLPLTRIGPGYTYNSKTLFALKVLRHDPASDEAERRMELHLFVRESNALERVRLAPGALQIIQPAEMWEESGESYMITEYVEGDTLAALMERLGHPATPYRVRHALDLAINIAASIRNVHQRGVIHRDLKPANMMVIPPDPHHLPLRNRIKIIDFGIAKLVGETEVDFTPRGTEGFFAPEQLLAFTLATEQTDIYAFGAVLYWMFTKKILYDSGHLVFAPARRVDDLSAHRHTQIIKIHHAPHPRALNPAVPVELGDLIFKALQQDPRARFDSMEHICVELINLFAYL